jgi:dihydrodipicolinate synthase/N-acetylneuraminate lyase
MTPPAVKAHFLRVADESPVPVLLYNIPKYMHFRLEPELIAELAQHENIRGMKDSAGECRSSPGMLSRTAMSTRRARRHVCDGA